MKLIVGLGNPGSRYQLNRHNIGFMVLDYLAEKIGCVFRKEPKFSGELAEVNFGGEKVFLLKPSTYMNLSGNSVRLLLDYFKINTEDILIIYDDLDIETGKLRIRTKGSGGGQKGMSSIIEKLATENINRIRMGISRPTYQKVSDYVLSDFPKEEMLVVREAMDTAVEAIELFIKDGDINKVMNRYNTK